MSDAEIILTVGHRMGPDKVMKRWQLKNISNGLAPNFILGKFIGKGKRILIFRLDGLKRVYAPEASDSDQPLIENLPLADSLIFQSVFSKKCFINERILLPKIKQTIIMNGADSSNYYPGKNIKIKSKNINLISNSWSINKNKGFKTISQFSKLNNVSVQHIGNWPDDVPIEKVQLLGVKDERIIGEILRNGHFLLFPSINEACPNVVVEALASGLPVLYKNSGGTGELCKDELFGLTLPNNTDDIIGLNYFLENAVDNYDSIRSRILEKFHLFSFQNCYEKYTDHFNKFL